MRKEIEQKIKEEILWGLKKAWFRRTVTGTRLCAELFLTLLKEPGFGDGMYMYKQKLGLKLMLELEQSWIHRYRQVFEQRLEGGAVLLHKLDQVRVWVRVLGWGGVQERVCMQGILLAWIVLLVIEIPLLLLALLIDTASIPLLILVGLVNATSIPLTGQLIFFIPEECVAELGVLHGRLIKQQTPIWKVRLMMLWCVLSLMWAFYIQINIENLGLPKIGGRGSNR